MILALQVDESTRVYLAGDPAQSEAVNGHLRLESSKHERRQVVHQGVSWENVKTKDLGNGRYEFQGWHWRTFDDYASAMQYAVLGADLDLYEGTVLLLIPTTGSTYQLIQIASAVLLPLVAEVSGVAVKIAWTIQGAWPTNAGTEVIGGDTLGDPGTGDTVGDPDTGDIAGDPTV